MGRTAYTLLYDIRADMFHPGSYFLKKVSDTPATVYLCGMADSEGRLLVAGKTYKLNVPKNVPVEQFWSLIVYDYATFAFIYSPLDCVGMSTYDKPNMKVNPDGSVDKYIGPTAPKGMESNWIPTQGKRPFPIMRIYGGDDAFWEKFFKLPDLELLE
jgi:hypothetical protein